MERQVLIRYKTKDETVIAERLLEVMQCLSDTDDSIICYFQNTKNDRLLIEEIERCLQGKKASLKQKKTLFGTKYNEISMSLSKTDLQPIVKIIKKNEWCVGFFFGTEKVIVNDNDGDFVVTTNAGIRKEVKKIMRNW